MEPRTVFVSGGTGYLGSKLLPQLLSRKHQIHALVRPGSEKKLSPGCSLVQGDALREATFQDFVPGANTYLHMVGVPHPSPSKAALFRSIDLKAVEASVAAAKKAAISHFVYVSVAHPAPIMKAYVDTRIEAEEMIRSSGLNATILRPWYVLGPGHRWAYALIPIYWLLERRPASRNTALRLGLVKLKEMIGALVYAVEHPVNGIEIIDVPSIRRYGATGIP